MDEFSELKYTADEAVLLLQEWFGRRSARMTRENLSFIDDLIQEMSMGVLQCKGAHPLRFYHNRAISRARDFLRKEKAHRFKKERYSLLSHPITYDDDTPFIEGMVDFEERLASRRESRNGVVSFNDDSRATA